MTDARETMDHPAGDQRTLRGSAPGPRAARGETSALTTRVRQTAGAHRVALMRIGFGLIWAIDAWYKWQPAFLSSFSDQVSRMPQQAPGWVTPWLQFWKSLLTPHATVFAVCTALLETVLAVGLLLGLGRRSLYVVGAVFSFLIWAVPETFGRFWESGQTDLGTSIVYVFIFVALFVVDAGTNAGGWSLDSSIEVQRPWWRRVAEFARDR